MPLRGFVLTGGERGIRTPGGFHLNGFQDRRIRPLCHLSGAKVRGQMLTPKIFTITPRVFLILYLVLISRLRALIQDDIVKYAQLY